MNSLDFFIGNPLVQIPPPFNWQEFETELSFENGAPGAVLNATKLVFKGENAHTISQWVQTGLTNGVGIFEGIPLVIKICDTQEIVFNGIIDLTDPETKFTCDIIEVKIRDRRMDMITQLMNSISFGFLATPTGNGGAGIINTNPQFQGGDYVVIPYQKNNVPDGLAFFTTALAIFQIAEKVYDALNILVSLTSGTGAAASVLGTGGVVLGITQTVGYIIYLAIMILVIIKLLKAAFNYLVSPVLTKFGMTAGRLFERACQYFGLQFSCSFKGNILDQLIIMPQKTAWSNNQTFVQTLMGGIIGGSSAINNRMEYDDLYNHQNGGFAYGYFDGTCGDFIRAMEDVFNAKAKVINNISGQPVLHFERWDYIYNVAQYQMPNVSNQTPFNSIGLFNNTGFSQSAFGTNASEIASNYYVKYAMDETDQNTYNYYEGSVCYCTNAPINVQVRKNVTLQNLTEVNLIFAQAHRKVQLTSCEEALVPLWHVADIITNVIIGITTVVNTIINSVTGLVSLPQLPTVQNGGLQFMPWMPPFANVGHLLLTNDSTGCPKMFMAGPNVQYNNWYDYGNHNFTGTTIDQNNKNIIGARFLMKNFHFSNLPQTIYPGPPYSLQLSGTTYYNQYLKFPPIKIPICCKEFDLIHNNNIAKTFNNQNARIYSLKWNLLKGIGTIEYGINTPYTKNLKTTFVVDGVETMQTL